ncbi:hypothetical protein C8R46DRAFT_1214018 [Mycena filopes]|nr:hypothetical protein C8R46DRAFT_1214018 [Mycena filopes]
MAKQLRKSNKLWAEGTREGIMRPHIADYADALTRGWRAERDYVQKVCNEFHSQISWQLEDYEEPPLPLPVYDPFAVVPVEVLSDEERKTKLARIEALNAQIRRWLKYRARSAGLGNVGIRSPRKPLLAYQQYMRESAAEIAVVVNERWAAQSIHADGSANTKKPGAPFRCAVARELFLALSSTEQAEIKARAVEEARAAKEAYKKAMSDGPSKAPEARQKCIDVFGRFMAPIMKGVQEYTGLQGFVMLGGPMPRYNGEVGTVHLAVGSNLQSVPSPFPGWDKRRWARDVVEFYTAYLRTAYTEQECREAALPLLGSTLADAPFSFMQSKQHFIPLSEF